MKTGRPKTLQVDKLRTSMIMEELKAIEKLERVSSIHGFIEFYKTKGVDTITAFAKVADHLNQITR